MLLVLKSYAYVSMNTLHGSNNVHQYFSFTHDSISFHPLHHRIKNTLNPDWTTTFAVPYELGTPVNILVKIFDEVRKGDNIEMGSGVFEMGAVLGAKGSSKAKEMKKGGTLFINAQKLEGTGHLKLKLSGISLTNTEGFLRKSDPFYEFTRKDNGQR